MAEINKQQVSASIWLMLPVSVVISVLLPLLSGETDLGIVVIPFMVLTYGAIIWIPSMLFTALLEYFSIGEQSTDKTVKIIFAIETAVTFVVITLIFGTYTMVIPLLALVMSVIIQVVRWYYLKHNDRLYCKAEGRKSAEIIDQES